MNDYKNRMFWICYIANSLLNYLLMVDNVTFIYPLVEKEY